ncbi:MAG: VOC family protein [Candidatus Zixiibacteriota bacterium]
MKISEQITFIYTNDLERTSKFYGEILGFPLVHDQGTCRIYKSTDKSYIGFCQKDIEILASHVILTFVTDDVDKYYEKLKEAEVDIVKKPQNNPEFNIYHLFCHDPNGYLVEIQRFNDPDWNKLER